MNDIHKDQIAKIEYDLKATEEGQEALKSHPINLENFTRSLYPGKIDMSDSYPMPFPILDRKLMVEHGLSDDNFGDLPDLDLGDL